MQLILEILSYNSRNGGSGTSNHNQRCLSSCIGNTDCFTMNTVLDCNTGNSTDFGDLNTGEEFDGSF
jgi:hypothetical protein